MSYEKISQFYLMYTYFTYLCDIPALFFIYIYLSEEILSRTL